MPYDIFADNSFFINESGEAFCNGKSLSVRDSAFLCYHLVCKADYKRAGKIVFRLAEITRQGKFSFMDEILWLWCAGEYFNHISDRTDLERITEAAEKVIKDAEEKWRLPDKNWICEAKSDCYLSNISAVYGALRSFCNVLREENAQKLMVQISEEMYARYMYAGMLSSLPDSSLILGDITVTAVPFALVDAGNQILVESVNMLEEKLIKCESFYCAEFKGIEKARDELNCLMSWYYAERGELAMAKEKLGLVSGRPEKPFNRILYSIAYENIFSKESHGLELNDGINFVHDEIGTGNPYRPGVAERYPLYPAEGDKVSIRMVTLPFDLKACPFLKYSVNGAASVRIPMEAQISKESERFWQANIGPFKFADRVEYSFVDGQPDAACHSKKYGFHVQKWIMLSKIISAVSAKDGATLYFEVQNSNRIPFLEFNKISNGSVSIRLGTADSIPVSAEKSSEKIIKIGMGENTITFDLANSSFSIDLPADDKLQSYPSKDKMFAQILIDDDGNAHSIKYRFKTHNDERFFGMGERYSHIEYSGLEIDNYVYNQYGSQKLRTYMPIPFAVSSDYYGLYLAEEGYSIFRFGSVCRDMLEIESEIDLESQNLTLYILTGTPKEILKRFTALTGKPELPPKWAFGPWMSSHNWDNQNEVDKQLGLLEAHEIPATVMVLEAWSDEATFYIFNDAQYQVKDGSSAFNYEDFTFPSWGRWPDPKKMVENLHKNGLKVLLWQAPVQKYMDGIAHAQRDEDEKTMLNGGYMVKKRSGKPYRIPSFEWFKNSLVPDFTNPEARKWWFSKRRYLVNELGIDGFKTDGGECLYGEDTVLYGGQSGNAARNNYPNIYIGAYHTFIEKENGNNGLTFSRAGFTGAQKNPMHWAGDERSTFEAFQSSVRAGLSCGLSGIPFWGWDLGGFKGATPSAELYIRSAQMATFCPVMQYHAETK